MADNQNNGTVATTGGDSHDLNALLSTPARDFLVRNTGEQVKIDSLKGKKLGLYFSASFWPKLVDLYNERSPQGDFDVIFVSRHKKDESFQENFSKMPWLAIPFSDKETRDRLYEAFEVSDRPRVVIIDENGRVRNQNAVKLISYYGAKAYPYTTERMKELEDEQKKAQRKQTLRSLLVTDSRDFVISPDGNKVPVSELEGKTVGLFFTYESYSPWTSFAPKLIEVYKKLKEQGENFEVVLIHLGNEEVFMEDFKTMPWYALPFGCIIRSNLVRYFKVSNFPTVVILGPDGKTLNLNAVEAIEEYGDFAYPFTPEKFAELEQIEKAKAEAQTLESVLVSGDLNYVIGKDGAKVPVSDLVGKTIILYFPVRYSPPWCWFTLKLIEEYHKIKAKDQEFEVIFISSDEFEVSYVERYSEMPWLALPYDDPRISTLSKIFKVNGISMLVALGPSGKTLTKDARDLISIHGADAYPFTEERLEEIASEMAKGVPEKVMHEGHEHELELTRMMGYFCDKCEEEGNVWSFHCGECDFDLHPKCALEQEKGNDDWIKKDTEECKEGFVCDWNV